MKRTIIALSTLAMLMLTGCGNKTNGTGGENDSTATPSVTTEAPAANLHSEEAIKAQVTAYYEELNKANEGEFYMSHLDSLACTQDLLALMKRVGEKSEEAIANGSDMYFEDEGYRWFQGLGTPISVQFDDISDPNEDRVEAFLTLTWESQTAQVRLRLKVEDGQWKINDFADYDIDGVGFRTDLNSFLGIDNGEAS